MNANIAQVGRLVDNMLIRVKKGEISTDKGLNFLEMKYHTLLSYLVNLTCVILKKTSGERLENDRSIDRLVELRTILEKIRPIDHKLKYQIDKFVRTAQTGGSSNDNDPSMLKANPAALTTKIVGSDEQPNDDKEEVFGKSQPRLNKSEVYVPPRFAAVHYDGDETAGEKLRKADERVRRRAISGVVLRELKEEYLDTPYEDTQALAEKQSSFEYKNKRKVAYEENYMTRLPVTKQEKHQRRRVLTLGTLGDEITNFRGTSTAPGSAKRKDKARGKGKKGFKKRRHH